MPLPKLPFTPITCMLMGHEDSDPYEFYTREIYCIHCGQDAPAWAYTGIACKYPSIDHSLIRDLLGDMFSEPINLLATAILDMAEKVQSFSEALTTAIVADAAINIFHPRSDYKPRYQQLPRTND